MKKINNKHHREYFAQTITYTNLDVDYFFFDINNIVFFIGICDGDLYYL